MLSHPNSLLSPIGVWWNFQAQMDLLQPQIGFGANKGAHIYSTQFPNSADDLQ